MFLNLYNVMVEFLQNNLVLVALLMAIVEYAKRELVKFEWVKSWMVTLLAFVIAFILAIPEQGFAGIVILEYIAHGVGLGLVATGIYKVGESIRG